MRLKIAYFSDSFGASLLYWGGPPSLSALELGMVAVEPPVGRVKGEGEVLLLLLL